jgi:hypothetical protein
VTDLIGCFLRKINWNVGVFHSIYSHGEHGGTKKTIKPGLSGLCVTYSILFISHTESTESTEQAIKLGLSGCHERCVTCSFFHTGSTGGTEKTIKPGLSGLCERCLIYSLFFSHGEHGGTEKTIKPGLSGCCVTYSILFISHTESTESTEQAIKLGLWGLRVTCYFLTIRAL